MKYPKIKLTYGSVINNLHVIKKWMFVSKQSIESYQGHALTQTLSQDKIREFLLQNV